MAFSLAEDRARPVSQSFQSALAWFQSALAWFRLVRVSVRRCGEGFLFSQRPRPVSLWNEVSLTLIARRWPCAFFLSDSKGMLDVKDTVLRRELASISLATRKTKKFFRGMLSAFTTGERHRLAS